MLQIAQWKLLAIFLFTTTAVSAWDNDDLEIFDVVEEVDQNFYELLGVPKDASSSEIKSAYRVLTLKLHPDKNPSPDADVQFRNLVSVYNIIKDPGKREKYNEVLTNGLPNWRSAVYYYRHVRKMGLTEMTIILFIIISFGQYIVGWAAYAEKRYFAEQMLESKLKKMQKKAVKANSAAGGNDLMELLAEIPAPSVKDTLPFQTVRLVIATIKVLPKTPGYILGYIAERKRIRLEEEELKREEEERIQWEEEEAAREKEAKGLRRRRPGFVPPEKTGSHEPKCFLDPVDEPEAPVPVKPLVAGGLWTDDDLTELVRLVKKFPGGTPSRWERISESMGRNVAEVTHMAAKLKDNCYRVPGHEQTEEIPGLEVTKKVKTKGGRVTAGPAVVESIWSQTQQKALEAALAKFPRSGAYDRWDKIAKCVQDKTREECMLRYKYLVELVKKQKSDEAAEQSLAVDQTSPLLQNQTPTCREFDDEADE